MAFRLRFARVFAALLWSTGLSLADYPTFSNINDFNTIANASHGFPNHTFHSSDIVAPIFQVNTFDKDAVDDAGYIFIGTRYGPTIAGPMILDATDLSLVYADQRYNNNYASDVQEINGTRYLTFWEGAHSRGHANGYCLVYDESYKLVYNVTAQNINGALADMHEMKFTDHGTLIFSTYWNKDYNCTSVGGPPDALLMESGFQEIDMATNEIIFNWAASDHFAIDQTYAKYTAGYGVGSNSGFDFFHINSIEKTQDGNYLISSRHMSMLALIDGHDGHPIWMLGGKNNQFHDLSNGAATNFSWQHDARFYKDQSHITMFDNHGEHTNLCEECDSRGLHLEIDSVNMTARVVQEYYHPAKVNSGAMGGVQALKNGNFLVGWGYNPGFVEYKPDGTPVMDVQRGMIGHGFFRDMFAYRVNKHDWKGRPTWPPNVAIEAPRRTTEDTTVYLSWNGATDISQWAVVGVPALFHVFCANKMQQFASDDATKINNREYIINISNRTGFETEIHLGSNFTRRYMGTAAISANGDILGSTSIYDMANGKPVMLASGITVGSIHSPPGVKQTGKRSIGLWGSGMCAFLVTITLAGYLWRRRSHVSSVKKIEYKRVSTDEERHEA
ncbi:hypothetical protein G7046_g5008 [Stylonectria norvegica]|nr:hypothetical protein G7046_g5008 [Stylonectria norvegica]